MAGWVEQVERKASLIEDQMRSAMQLVERFGDGGEDAIAPYSAMLRKLYREDLPIARVLDDSDIVLHAEGPSLGEKLPGLRAVNWLCGAAERQLRILATAVMGLADIEERRIRKLLDLRLTGMAPGSLYAGFKLEEPPSSLFDSDTFDLMHDVRFAIRSVAYVPRFIEDEMVSDGISEAIPDPASRDAAMEAAFRLSPTGRAGIHTVDVSAPDIGSGSLSQRERVVLKAALDSPSQEGTFGRFVGDAREIDMDLGRIYLRNIKSVGSLRCVVGPISREDAARLIGSTVRVEGRYQTDKKGRPRLMVVEHITAISRSEQDALDI